MTNYEKYKDEIEKIVLDGGIIAIDRETNKLCNCNDFSICGVCKFNGITLDCPNKRKEWLNAEYKEPEIDWSKVPKGTRVWVRELNSDGWRPSLFIEYMGLRSNKYGATFRDMWVFENSPHVTYWKYCKLDDSVDPTPYYKDR